MNDDKLHKSIYERRWGELRFCCIYRKSWLSENEMPFLTWIDVKAAQITSCDRGLMKDGLLADCFPCLNIRAMRLVLVSNAPYTTVKQKPAQNLYAIPFDMYNKNVAIGNIFPGWKCKHWTLKELRKKKNMETNVKCFYWWYFRSYFVHKRAIWKELPLYYPIICKLTTFSSL